MKDRLSYLNFAVPEQVRRLDADVRHERLDRDRLGSTDPSFNSTLNGHSQFLSSTL